MDLEGELARGVLEAHPDQAARLLEGLGPADVADLLAKADPELAAGVLRRMASPAAARVLAELPRERAAHVLIELPVEVAAPCLRSLAEAIRQPLLSALPESRARALASLLRFRPGTAGALMDPEVLALAMDLTQKEAMARVREAAESARYNVYVVDREQRLVGVVNLRELMLARPAASLESIMHSEVHRLRADNDRQAIVSNPAWREVHALPVVDAHGVYLGALRYRAFRALEEELHAPRSEAGQTARVLGDLFRTGALSVLETVASTAPERPRAPGSTQHDG
jgi:magnesium transporter